MNGLAGCCVSTIAKPYEYLDPTTTENEVDAPGTLQGSHCEWVHPLDNVNVKSSGHTPLAAENRSKLPRAIRSDGAAVLFARSFWSAESVRSTSL